MSDGSIFEGPTQHFISDHTAGDIIMTYLVLYRQFQSIHNWEGRNPKESDASKHHF